MNNLRPSLLIRKVFIQKKTTTELEDYFGMKLKMLLAELEDFFATQECAKEKMESFLEQLKANDFEKKAVLN